MPLYVFTCPNCGPFELLLPLRESERKRAKCACGLFGSRAAELAVMKPDALWAGQKNQYGYFTSAGALKQEMKRRNHVVCGDRTDLEGMDKVAEKAAVEREQKGRKRIRGVMERAFGPSGLGLGGADGGKMLSALKSATPKK